MTSDTPGSHRRERGSIIVAVATDLPLMPHQLKRLARRAAIGIGRNGTPGGNSSGDIFLAFSTANAHAMPHRRKAHIEVGMINDEVLDPVYLAAVESVEEAVVNAMLAADDMGGSVHDRVLIKAIDHDELCRHLRAFGRLA
jgi:L-aminopeptidase/D-esterase-like protein